MSNFRTVDRETAFLLPPSVDEWLPERHLARFVVETIEQLDLSTMSSQANNIIPRRYFYPAVDSYTALYKYAPHSKLSTRDSRRSTMLASSLASRILCLPLYWKLPEDDMRRIATLVGEALS